MGHYTRLVANFNLPSSTPEIVIKTLEFMLDEKTTPENVPFGLPSHPLFATERWAFMLHTDSYYFAGHTYSGMRFDQTSQQYEITINANLKNYNSEIEKFVDWIAPFVEAYQGGFLGYMLVEDHELPTLIYLKAGGQIIFRTPYQLRFVEQQPYNNYKLVKVDSDTVEQTVRELLVELLTEMSEPLMRIAASAESLRLLEQGPLYDQQLETITAIKTRVLHLNTIRRAILAEYWQRAHLQPNDPDLLSPNH